MANQPTEAPRPQVDTDLDDCPLDAEVIDEVIERLIRIETRLCKLIVALGYEKLITPKD